MATSHVSFTVQPVKVQSRAEFCKNHLETICFWDSAMYSIVETDTLEDRRPAPTSAIEIGGVSALFYRRICPDLKLDYNLGNATDYLNIHGHVLRTSQLRSIDHDSLNPGPGPVLFVQLQCTVQIDFETAPTKIMKAIQINILDKNDNYPVLHNGKHNHYMPDPHFKEVRITNAIIPKLITNIIASNQLPNPRLILTWPGVDHAAYRFYYVAHSRGILGNELPWAIQHY